MINVLGTIRLISPEGKTFDAKWMGNQISITKKVAVFEYPDVDGATVQDLGLASQKYPLDLWFDGSNHMEISQNFQVALQERGEWNVHHPVYGVVSLQPLSATFEVQPVKSAAATLVATQWVRTTPEFEGLSFSFLENSVVRSVYNLTSVSLEDHWFFKALKFFTTGINFIKGVLSAIENAVAKFYTISNRIRSGITGAIAAVKRLLDIPGMLMRTVIGAINDILAIPSKVDAYVKDKIAFYESLWDDVKETVTGDRVGGVLTPEVAAINDSVQAGILAGMAESTTNGVVLSREEAVEIGDSIVAMYKGMILLSDENQEALIARYSQEEYFSNITTFEEMRNLVGVTLGYVLDDNYSESTKQTITLGTSAATLDLAVKYYPTKNEEEAYDFFVSTNLLSGDEIITLPVGKVVVIYS